MIDGLKDYFAWVYKRFCWGYEFFQKFIALFNFVGILLILFRGVSEEVSRWVLVPLLVVSGLLVCIGVGYIMFDVLGFKTKFAKQEGMRDDYWTHQLTPIQQKILLVYLDAVKNPKKVKELRERVESGKL